MESVPGELTRIQLAAKIDEFLKDDELTIDFIWNLMNDAWIAGYKARDNETDIPVSLFVQAASEHWVDGRSKNNNRREN